MDDKNFSVPYIVFEGAEAKSERTIKRLIDGICYEPLAEEFKMSVRQIKNIVYKSETILFSHFKF